MYLENVTTPLSRFHMFGGDGSSWDHMMYGSFGAGMHPFGGLFMILLFVALAYFLFSLVRRPRDERPLSASDVLKLRLARGEITREEFDETLKSVS